MTLVCLCSDDPSGVDVCCGYMHGLWEVAMLTVVIFFDGYLEPSVARCLVHSTFSEGAIQASPSPHISPTFRSRASPGGALEQDRPALPAIESGRLAPQLICTEMYAHGACKNPSCKGEPASWVTIRWSFPLLKGSRCLAWFCYHSEYSC